MRIQNKVQTVGSIKDKELEKLNACINYCNYVYRRLNGDLQGLSWAECKRIELHNNLCKLFGIEKKYTTMTTDNLGCIDYDGKLLYDKLTDIKSRC